MYVKLHKLSWIRNLMKSTKHSTPLKLNIIPYIANSYTEKITNIPYNWPAGRELAGPYFIHVFIRIN